MSAADIPSITDLLEAARSGDRDAFDALYERVYAQLRRLARVVRQGRASDTLNTTALVHEAYLHLVPSATLSWENRAHFFAVAARAMRQVLVQTARRRLTEKRGGGMVHLTLGDDVQDVPMALTELISMDDALKQLETLDARQARVVECRFFAGLTIEETAEALGVGTATVKRDWRAARAWLTNALRP